MEGKTAPEPLAVPTPTAERAPTSNLSVRQLVLREIEEAGFPLTKMDVVSRLSAAGHRLNSGTVGSTLSKLVEAGFLEKSGHSAYRAKGHTTEGVTAH